MANYVTILAATVLLVFVILMVKIHNLNEELRRNAIKHELAIKSVLDDVAFCEQRAENYKSDVEREVAAKQKAEKSIRGLERQLEIKAREVAALDQKQREYQALQATHEQLQIKLNNAMTNIEAITREREDAKKEVHKYYNLYKEGTKLLQDARQQCEAKKAYTAKQTAEQLAGGGQGGAREVVVKEASASQQNAAAKTDTQQQGAQQQDTQQQGTQQKGTQQEDSQQQGNQQQESPPSKIQDKNAATKQKEQENGKKNAGGVPQTNKDNTGGKNVNIIAKIDAQKEVEAGKDETVEVRELDADATGEEARKEERTYRR